MSEEKELAAWCDEHFGADGSGFLTASGIELPGPDNALFADANAAAALTSTVAEAFRQGVAGYAQDVFIQGRPWPFDPGRIAISVDALVSVLESRRR